ncbi:MAG: hypothetical protein N2515_01520 [Deltaproteobacteria bacterium]|nr:hypothetical protein [Deltaproteobacteria bacterium]
MEALLAIVGKLGTHHADFVLLSDIELAGGLAMARKGEPEKKPSAEVLKRCMELWVAELVIVREAQRLGMLAPSQGDLERHWRMLENAAGGALVIEAIIQRLHASKQEVAAIVFRRALVERFLNATLIGPSSTHPQMLEQAYQTEAHPYSGKPFAEVEATFRDWFRMEELDRQILHMYTRLIERAEVRIVRTPSAWSEGSR